MKRLIYTLPLVLFFTCLAWAQNGNQKHHANFPLDCNECHVCKKPTYEKPCLKLFPDFKRDGITVYNSADDAPELLKIDVLSNLYEPSIFTHKLHAEMAEMSGGCIACHHFNPPGKIIACRECHESSLIRDDLTKPGLKGAYHRQCMNCHKEWSHQTDCVVCHQNKTQPTSIAKLADKEQFVGKAHEKIAVPSKIIYKTDLDDGPLVTFFHDEHVNLFGISCVSCHKQETCSRCHDTIKTDLKTKKEVHENCNSCHEQAINKNCDKCHANKEKNRFDHKTTGWSLNRYHKNLNCSECHNSGNTNFIKPNKQCISCHNEWPKGKFNHKVTGLDLDETHKELECSDCHSNNNFDVKPVCDDCHEGFKYPKNKPGRSVSR